ncbi:hypothetical protein O181_003945 [Austropuccinia psidii MF-1]|uniref:Uncharacterized protein n=1 Tax=Austropuccinia psidii MF-1 TaxID=1389203 RepID=A0A9Q3GEE3_9BASI|nr:hypothetical protein [Austropuccinia psidii MF-1]
MKAPDSLDGTETYKLRGFIESCQLIFHNDLANFFSDRKKVLYSTSFLTGRAGKCIKPFPSNIYNEDPSFLLNNWQLFETQVRKAEQELKYLRMKESGQVSLYIVDFGSLMSRIGDWGKRPMFMCIEEAWHQDCWTN